VRLKGSLVKQMLLEVVKSSEFEETHMKLVPIKIIMVGGVEVETHITSEEIMKRTKRKTEFIKNDYLIKWYHIEGKW
jgi:hypothetical protein